MIHQAITEGSPRIRRFAQGDSGDYFSIQYWLLGKGYELHNAKSAYYTTCRKTGRRTKFRNWSCTLEFVDELRQAEGLEPLVRRA